MAGSDEHPAAHSISTGTASTAQMSSETSPLVLPIVALAVLAVGAAAFVSRSRRRAVSSHLADPLLEVTTSSAKAVGGGGGVLLGAMAAMVAVGTLIGFVGHSQLGGGMGASMILEAEGEGSTAAKKTLGAFIAELLTGGISGSIAKTIAAPIERVKLIIQTQDANPKIVSGEVPRYDGIGDTFVRVWNEEGPLSFWRGNLPNVLRYFPIAAFNFAFNDQIKAWFPDFDPVTQFWPYLAVNVAAGGIAGALSLTLVYPLDYARTRLATDMGKADSSKREFNGLADCLMKTVRANGFFSLYIGYGLSVVGIVVYRGPFFGLFDVMHHFNPWKYKAGGSSASYLLAVFTAFLIAQLVSIIAGFISYPFDTMRRRLQMEANIQPHLRIYKGSFHCAYVILRQEGMGAFFKGFLANVYRGALTSVMLVIYREVTVHVLHI